MGQYNFILPDIGEGVAEAEIVAWHVSVGDVLAEDDKLVDMMTDKATVEIEIPVAGRVTRLAGAVGDTVAIGSVLVVIETEEKEAGQAAAHDQPTIDGSAIAEYLEPPVRQMEVLPETQVTCAYEQPAEPSLGKVATDTAARVLATPAVRARARELGVDLAQVDAPEGRIRHGDLDTYLRYNQQQGFGAPSRKRADEVIKVIGMRRRIAEKMALSKRHIPHFTYVDEIDVTSLEAMRGSLNLTRGDRPKLTLLPLLIVAICRTLPDFPEMNARYDDEAGEIIRFGAVHMGMATRTDSGLIVPVIRGAQGLNVWQLAREISRLAEAARSGTTALSELTDGTFTITSLGSLGGIMSTPVINRPEVAIIAPNRIMERAVFDGDNIRHAKLMNLSISCDHRVLDGWNAANFNAAGKRLLETPVLLFAE